MAVFEVVASYDVPLRKIAHGQVFDDEGIKELGCLKDFQKRGCYIFCINYPNGKIPIYVGKTQDRSFGSRAFSADNRLRTQDYLNSLQKLYSMSIFLVAQKSAPGAPNIRDIDRIESWLISKARQRNPNLLNKRKVGNIVIAQQLEIAHLLKSRVRGKPPRVVSDFKSMMGLNDRTP